MTVKLLIIGFKLLKPSKNLFQLISLIYVQKSYQLEQVEPVKSIKNGSKMFE